MLCTGFLMILHGDRQTQAQEGLSLSRGLLSSCFSNQLTEASMINSCT